MSSTLLRLSAPPTRLSRQRERRTHFRKVAGDTLWVVPRKSGREPSRVSSPRWESPTLITSVSAGLVALVLVVIVVVNQLGAGNGEISSSLPDSVASVVLHPNASVIKAVGSGSQSGDLTRLDSSTTLTGSDGKPLIVYVGGEYCPFCAAERWTMLYWLSQFGTFKGLTETQSSSTDTDPNTATVSFDKSTYTSSIIDFSATEAYDRNGKPLEPLTAQVSSIFNRYDRPPDTAETGAFPFVDIAGRYVLFQTSYSPDLLRNLTWDQIATKMKDPSDPVCKAIVGNAEILTAATCIALGYVPASVSSPSTIQAIEPALETS